MSGQCSEKWVKANSPGQAPKSTPNPEAFQPGLHVESALGEGMEKPIAGARAGDYRFYGENAAPFYVIHVVRREPAKPMTLDTIGETIAKIVYQVRMVRQIDEWGTKLRKASEIQIHASGDELLRLVMRDLTGGN